MNPRSLAEDIMFSTVRIKAQGKDENGDAFQNGGTGFIFGYSLDKVQQGKDEGKWAFFIVTNKHVVEGCTEGSFTFIQSDGNKGPRLGHGVEQPVESFDKAWFGHPNKDVDITVMPIGQLLQEHKDQGIGTFVAPVLKGHVPSKDVISELDVTDSIFFTGYPNGIQDRLNLIPIVRSGNIATPLELDFDGEPVFLIDASVFPGSSGSPVFLSDTPIHKNKQNEVVVGGRRTWFLGVVSSVFNYWNDGTLQIDPIPTTHNVSIKSQEMLDLGVVFKSSTVLETVEDFLSKHASDYPRH